jgi:hypothetical protein
MVAPTSIVPSSPITASRPGRAFGSRCRLALTLVLLIAFGILNGRAQTQSKPEDAPSASTQIVQRMVESNAVRAEHLKYSFSRRHYHVEYHGFGRNLDATMDVEATYNTASGKTFRVTNQSGSHVLIDHVLKKLLDTEQDDSRSHDAALTPTNYRFNMVGDVTENGRRLYVFAVEPKVKKKLLYRGRIWVDADDYAVVRVEAQPAENPSFWIKNTEIHQLYTKTGEFWLPQQNKSETKVRLGGTAILTIDYGNYQFDAARNESLQSSTVAAAH